MFFDFEDSFIFNPNAVISGYANIRAKIRLEFKEDRYRVTLMKIRVVNESIENTLSGLEGAARNRFLKIKNRTLQA